MSRSRGALGVSRPLARAPKPLPARAPLAHTRALAAAGRRVVIGGKVLFQRSGKLGAVVLHLGGALPRRRQRAARQCAAHEPAGLAAPAAAPQALGRAGGAAVRGGAEAGEGAGRPAIHGDACRRPPLPGAAAAAVWPASAAGRSAGGVAEGPCGAGDRGKGREPVSKTQGQRGRCVGKECLAARLQAARARARPRGRAAGWQEALEAGC